MQMQAKNINNESNDSEIADISFWVLKEDANTYPATPNRLPILNYYFQNFLQIDEENKSATNALTTKGREPNRNTHPLRRGRVYPLPPLP